MKSTLTNMVLSLGIITIIAAALLAGVYTITEAPIKAAQLNKQIDVIKVRMLPAETATRRELVLVKVNADQQNRGGIIDIASILNAKIVDLSHTTLTVELCDRPEKVDLLLEMLTPYGIAEVARTGMVALQKGSEAIQNI